MDEHLEEIKARWAKVSVPPWNVARASHGRVIGIGPNVVMCGMDGMWITEPDAEAIAAAPEDVRWLLDYIAWLDSCLLSAGEGVS
jgi:hypothetical protein